MEANGSKRLAVWPEAGGRLLLAGKRNVEVARALGVSLSSVKRWKAIVRREGLEGLRRKIPTGRPAKLSPRQRQRLVGILCKGARAAGFSSELWTGRRVAQVIRSRFRVDYHPHHVLKLLHQLGFTPQKPQRRAREQDQQALKRWRRVEWPRIKRGRAAGDSR